MDVGETDSMSVAKAKTTAVGIQNFIAVLGVGRVHVQLNHSLTNIKDRVIVLTQAWK